MKILFIACYSPLINNSASIETLQYLNNLIKEGNEVDLLTVDFPKNSVYYDEKIYQMLDKGVNVHLISGGKLFERVMPRKSLNSKVTSSAKNSKIKTMLKGIKKAVAIPDMYLNWANIAARYGIELMEEKNFDIIFSMHEPPSSHICALKIKERFKDIPWVTYWSDPWLKDSTRQNINFIRRKIEKTWEAKVVNLTDKLIFVTEANRLDYINTYKIPKEKTCIITRGYDKNLYDQILTEGKPVKIDTNRINVVYAGEIFSKLRDVHPFMDALNNLKNNNLEVYNKLNVLFFGNVDDKTVELELLENKKIDFNGRIPYDEALRYILNAEVLIIFGNKNSKQIPAKIYDYYGTMGRVFVILGDENDPIKNVVNNKCVVVKNCGELIEKEIVNLVDEIRAGKVFEPLIEYEWSSISKRLNSILEEARSCM